MSTRLTKAKRDEIAKLLITRGFDYRYKTLEARGKPLFMRIVSAAWGESYELVQKIPTEMFNSDACVHVRLTCGDTYSLQSDFPKRTPSYFETWRGERSARNISSPTDPTLNHDINRLLDDANAYFKERSQAEADIYMVLNSVTTTKRLYEIWPELAPVVPQVEHATSTCTALAPVISDLNRRLNLTRQETSNVA